MKKIFSFLLLGLVLSIGNAWADLSKASSIAAGDQVAFVCESAKAELTGISGSSTKYGSQTAYQTSPAGTLLFDVVAGASDGTFAFKNGDNYLVWNTGSKNSLDYSTTLNANSSWTVSFSNGDAIILNASDTNRKLRYNSSSPRFACYTTDQTAIQLYKVVAGGACATPNISGDATFYESTEISIACATDDASIYYTLDGSVPTSSSSPYSAPFSITATTTVKAIAVKDGLNDSEVASQTFTLVPLMTVAQARAAIDAQTGTQGAYARGVVSSIVSEYDEGFKNITFNFVDQAGDEAFLQAYRCLGAEAANVAVGDTVIVTGNLTKYNTTYEFGQGCQIVSLKHPVAPAVPSIDVEETSINVPYTGALDGVINVTYNNITQIVADVAFFESDGTTPLALEPDWIVTDIDIQTHNLVYVVDVNEGAARTAYMKVVALDDEANDVYSELITVTQSACVYATLPFFFNDGRADIENTPGLTQDGLDSDYGSSPKLKFNTTGDYLVLRLNEAPGLLSFDIKGNPSSGSWTGTFKVQTSIDGTDYSDLAVYTDNLSTSKTTIRLEMSSSVRYIKWILTDRKANVALGNIKLLKPVILGANGYSTFAADFKYTVSGADVYEAALNGAQDAIILTKVENAVVPANAGIILKGTEGATVTITPSNAAASDFAGNELVGVLTPTLAQANWYVLATNLDGDGLTKFHNCYAGIEIPANKAYMVIGEATAPSIRIIEAGNEATDIQNVEGAEKAVKFMENGNLYILKNGVVYDAMGKTVR